MWPRNPLGTERRSSAKRQVTSEMRRRWVRYSELQRRLNIFVVYWKKGVLVVERTLSSVAFCASSSAFFAASSRAFRSSSSFIFSMSPLRMYLFGRCDALSSILRLEAISALRASMVALSEGEII